MTLRDIIGSVLSDFIAAGSLEAGDATEKQTRKTSNEGLGPTFEKLS
jgi:hypothetical protein